MDFRAIYFGAYDTAKQFAGEKPSILLRFGIAQVINYWKRPYCKSKMFSLGGGSWLSDCGVPLRHCAQEAHDDERGEGENVQGNRALS